MKVAAYVVEHAGIWCFRLSLALEIDLIWWKSERVCILDPAMPLGWAVSLRESFRYQEEMHQWKVESWDRYVREMLKEEWEVENEIRHGRTQNSPLNHIDNQYIWMVKSVFVGRVGAEAYALSDISRREEMLEFEADLLSDLLAGRSLLETELTALLSENYPDLTKRWRSGVQLAHLKGRLALEAAVQLDPASDFSAAARRRTRQPISAGGRVQAHILAAALQHVRLPWRGAARRRAIPRCQRCGSAVTARTACAACGLAACAYCEACLALGRSRSCALLLRSAALPAAPLRSGAASDPTVAARRWGLSAAQAEAAGAALVFMAEPRKRSADPCPERFLLWAVTGAGKTEMIFPLLEAVLAAGGRALVATPRRDVVLELAPRLAKAFPAETIAVLYGGSPDRWTGGRLTLATTHQLLRFHRSFDLVILDELDAYPFHNDPMLAYAAEQACKRDGTFIYLSATPPQQLQKQAKKGRLAHVRVPVRFHGYPLPVPKHLTIPALNICLKREEIPKSLLQELKRSIYRGAQIFLFVSRIAHIEKLLPILRRSLPGIIIAGTSSQDPERANKVIAFRDRDITLLVTTTILERGVTVPRSDVFIIDADSSLFDEAALVQMAGRAGRSKDDPAGNVVFASPQWSKPQRGAISQIRTMNRIAERKGFFRKESLQ